MGQQVTNPNLSTERILAGNVKSFALLGAFSSWAAVVLYIFVGLRSNDPNYGFLAVVGVATAAIMSAANFFANREMTKLAAWLLILDIEFSFIAMNYAIANLAIVLAIILLFVVMGLIRQTLSGRSVAFAYITGVVASIAAFVVGQFLGNPHRIVAPNWFVEILIVVAGIVLLLLAVNLLRVYPFRSIRTQTVAAFVAISIIPLTIIAIPQMISSSFSLQEAANASLAGSARDVANDADGLLSDFNIANDTDAQLPVFINFLTDQGSSSDDVLAYMHILTKEEPYAVSYSLLDKSGAVLVSTQNSQVGKNKGAEADVQNAMQNRETVMSDIAFDPVANKHVFYISSPIVGQDTEIMGLLRVEYNCDVLQSEITEQASNKGGGLIAILVDENGIVIANNNAPESRFKSLVPLSPERLAALQASQVLTMGTAESLSLGLSTLAQNLDENNQNLQFQAPMSPGSTDTDVVIVKSLSEKPWRMAVGQPTSVYISPVNDQIRTVASIALVVILITLFAANLTANLLIAPINQLAAAAKQIGQGDLDAPIRLEREDEIGQLSEVIASTAAKLKQNLEGLEGRVEERTVELAHATQETKRRANQLRSIAEITRAITTIQNIDELLPEVARQISEALKFYHVGIFLIDSTGQYAVLQAANSEGGKKMLERGHRLKVGQTGIVGFVTGVGQPRIALNVGDDAIFFNNPDLPDTRSEMALPLRIAENIIGALDVQSAESSAFDNEDIGILSLLADQISIAIQNARLFQETRGALAEAQMFYRQSAAASWRDVVRQGTTGYRYVNGNVEAIKAVEDSVAKSTTGHLGKKNGSGPELLTIPINVRGKSLGVLSIRHPGRGRSWSEPEIRVYQAIVDRISFALENARLYQDAQRRASKERVIGEIATKVSGSVNMDNILQTAVEELGRVLPGSEVVIQFEQEDETSA